MRYLRLVAVLAFLVVAGCSSESDPEFKIEGLDMTLLASDASALWSLDATYTSVPRDQWTASIADLGPEAVIVQEEGVYLRMTSRAARETGLFVLPENSEFRPGIEGDPSYLEVGERVFLYKVKG